MKTSFYLMLYFAVIFSLPARAALNCAKAKREIDLKICLDPGLKAFDSVLQNLYDQLASNPKVLSSQKEWLKTRDACMSKPADSRACLRNEMLSRVSALADLSNQPAHYKSMATDLFASLVWNDSIGDQGATIGDIQVYKDLQAIANQGWNPSTRFWIAYAIDARDLSSNEDCLKVIHEGDPKVFAPENAYLSISFLATYIDVRKSCKAPKSDFETEAPRYLERLHGEVKELVKKISALLPPDSLSLRNLHMENPEHATPYDQAKQAVAYYADILSLRDSVSALRDQLARFSKLTNHCPSTLKAPSPGSYGCEVVDYKLKKFGDLNHAALYLWYTSGNQGMVPVVLQVASKKTTTLQTSKFPNEFTLDEHNVHLKDVLEQNDCNHDKVPDLIFQAGEADTGGPVYECFIYDPQQKQFAPLSSPVE